MRGDFDRKTGYESFMENSSSTQFLFIFVFASSQQHTFILEEWQARHETHFIFDKKINFRNQNIDKSGPPNFD